MTQLGPEYFERLNAEIARWRDEGYVELETIVEGTEFVLDDLVLAGVIEPKLILIPGIDSIEPYMPAQKWSTQFLKGECPMHFVKKETADEIIQLLRQNDKVFRRAQRRLEKGSGGK